MTQHLVRIAFLLFFSFINCHPYLRTNLQNEASNQDLFSAFQFNSDGNRKIMTESPIIGILTKPGTEGEYEDYEFFEKRYVHFVEAGGARAVPIKYTSTHEEMDKIFSQINGVLFTGGGSDLVTENGSWIQFSLAGKYLISLAKKANDNGDYFPIWGICLGFEMMIILEAEEDILGFCPYHLCSSYNPPLVMENESTPYNTKMLSLFTPEYFTIAQISGWTPNWHSFLVLEKDFYESSTVSDTYKIVATSYSTDFTIKYIAMVEGKKYPFYAVQFHPEKNVYKFYPGDDVVHTLDAIRMSQFFSLFFVNEARLNAHSFPDVQQQNLASVYHHKIVFYANEFRFIIPS